MNNEYSIHILGNDEKQQLSQKLTRIASEAVLGIGDMLADAFGGKITVEDKTGFRDLVTEFDRQSEHSIISYILKHYPDSVIVGEESGTTGTGSVQWYIDPIDGTSNFSAGIPFFCVSVGAAVKNQMVGGVIFDPVRHELFSASLAGAQLNGQPISTSHCTSDSDAILLTDFPYSNSAIFPNDAEYYKKLVKSFGSVRRLGSVALELAYVAAGRVDAAFSTLAGVWDVAAGLFLVQQAGGQIIALNRLYAQSHDPTWPVPYFIATGSEFKIETSTLSSLLDSHQ